MQFREVFFDELMVFSAVNIFQLEKFFKTKSRLCQKCSCAVGIARVFYLPLFWYSEI